MGLIDMDGTSVDMAETYMPAFGTKYFCKLEKKFTSRGKASSVTSVFLFLRFWQTSFQKLKTKRQTVSQKS